MGDTHDKDKKDYQREDNPTDPNRDSEGSKGGRATYEVDFEDEDDIDFEAYDDDIDEAGM